MHVTPAALKTYAQRYGLRSGYKPGSDWNKKYFEKHIKFLKKNVPGRHYSEVVKIFNKRFGFSITARQLASLCKRVGIQTGFTGFFPKGHVPHNKGVKGVYYPGCEKGWFKKGQRSMNYMPVGTERINPDGYIEIKVSDTAMPVQRRWKAKHIIVWEKAHGKIPKKHYIVFLDGNKNNISLDNLMLVHQGVHGIMNSRKLYTNNIEKTKEHITLANLKLSLAKKKRESSTKFKGHIVVFDNYDNRIWIERIENKWIAVRNFKKGIRQIRANLKPRDKRKDAERDLYEYALSRGWQRIKE